MTGGRCFVSAHFLGNDEAFPSNDQEISARSSSHQTRPRVTLTRAASGERSTKSSVSPASKYGSAHAARSRKGRRART